MNVRAKMVVSEFTLNRYCTGAKKIRLECHYDQSIPEDQRFFATTPSGHLEMLVSNPAVLEALALGKAFYLNLVPVPED